MVLVFQLLMHCLKNLKLEIYRDGKKYYIEFQNGEAKSPLKINGKSKETGTQITFLSLQKKYSLLLNLVKKF